MHIFSRAVRNQSALVVAVVVGALGPGCLLDDAGVDGGRRDGGGGTPTLDSRLWAGVVGHAFVVTGSGLSGGTNGDEAIVTATLNGVSLTVLEASATHFRAELPADAVSGRLAIETEDGDVLEADFDVYAYRAFDVPPTEGTAGAPLSIAIDNDRQVFLNEEFHRAIHRLDGTNLDSIVEQVSIPYPAGAGPFASTLFGDRQTTTSTLGEDVEVAPDGAVWFTEGGGSLYEGDFENHSRVVRYVPDGDPAFYVYNVPGDGNEVIGVTYDVTRNRVWFTEGGLGQAALWSFDPDAVAPDNTFDFSTSLDAQVCEPGDTRTDCFTRYPLQNPNAFPAHVVIDAEGFVWFTHFWGTALGVLDPEANLERTFPLPVASQSDRPFIGSGPWDLLVDDDGHIVFNEYFDGAVFWFDRTRLSNAECLTLNPAGENPCVVTSLETNGPDDDHQVHSISAGRDGRLWLSSKGVEDRPGRNAVGFVVDQKTVVWLPTMETLDPVPDGRAGLAGITVDPTNGDVYVAEFWRDRIGRFTRLSP